MGTLCVVRAPPSIIVALAIAFLLPLHPPCDQMLGALETVAQLCALGLGLRRDDITSLMHEGPHLLAPTGK